MIERKGLVFSENDLRMTGGNASTNSTHVNSLGGTLWTNPIARKRENAGINKKTRYRTLGRVSISLDRVINCR